MIKVHNDLYRGQRPKSFRELEQAGISNVINLQSGIHEKFNDDEYEKEIAEEFGIKEHNLKCSDFFPPTENQVAEFLKIHSESQCVYVHCLHGKDRTGFMCAVFRMKFLGWTYKASVKEMFSHGFHKFPYIWWLIPLLKYRNKSKI